MSNMGLKQKLMLAFGVLIIIVGITVSCGSFLTFSNVYRKRAQQYIGDNTRQTTNNFEHNIATIEKITLDLLKNSVIQRELKLNNGRELSGYKQNLQNKRIEAEIATHALYDENIVSLSVIDLKGREFTIRKDVYTPITKIFTQEQILEANGSTIWSVSMDEKEQICIGRAILNLNTMKPIGTINVVCEKNYFASMIQDISGPFPNRVYVVDQQGMIMCSSQDDYIGTPLADEILDLSKTKVDVDDLNYYVYRGSIMPNGWSIITLVPVNEIDRELSSFFILTIGITFGCILVGIVIIFYLITRMMWPLQTLSSHMRAIEAGDFTNRVEINSNDEIGQLGRRYNHMADSIENLIEQVYKMEISQKQAEIEYLKMQINPHFLYNTLDTISWMARMEDKDDIAQVTTALAELLRATIKQNSFITVREELKSVRNYVFIQEYRFGDKIRVCYDIDGTVRDYVIPNFILQPLVENAIIHGLEPKLTWGKLTIGSYIEGDHLHFRVKDDGIGMNAQAVEKLYEECLCQDSKNSIGIKNVYLRLHNYYGEDSTFVINSREGEGTTVAFSIAIKRLQKSI